MQTYLPYKEFSRSAYCLDPARCRNQLIGAYQILNSLITENSWFDQKAVRMWEGSEYHLLDFFYHCRDECNNRGYKVESITKRCDKLIKENDFFEEFSYQKNNLPYFVGDWDFHNNCKGNLLFKGRIDVIAKRIQKHYKIKNVSQKLKDFGVTYAKAKLTFREVIYLEMVLENLNVPYYDIRNWYDQFDWGVDYKEKQSWPE